MTKMDARTEGCFVPRKFPDTLRDRPLRDEATAVETQEFGHWITP